jgi:hypothetical protein
MATASGVQCAKHGTRDWDRSASMVLFADQVKLFSCLLMAREAIHAEAKTGFIMTSSP